MPNELPAIPPHQLTPTTTRPLKAVLRPVVRVLLGLLWAAGWAGLGVWAAGIATIGLMLSARHQGQFERDEQWLRGMRRRCNNLLLPGIPEALLVAEMRRRELQPPTLVGTQELVLELARRHESFVIVGVLPCKSPQERATYTRPMGYFAKGTAVEIHGMVGLLNEKLRDGQLLHTMLSDLITVHDRSFAVECDTCGYSWQVGFDELPEDPSDVEVACPNCGGESGQLLNEGSTP